jgi:hypothetical protein
MKEFWNERYSEKEYVYGESPNKYLKKQLLQLPTGKILFPCEGEGRNAVFAAANHWDTFCVILANQANPKLKPWHPKTGCIFNMIFVMYWNIKHQYKVLTQLP